MWYLFLLFILSMRYVGIWFRGLLMGICDVIPGVSGGTIAFITGIYDELLDALHGFNMDTVYLLTKARFADAWKAVHGNFLLSLVLGIVFAIGAFATLITHLLETYPSFILSFFLGLILASVVVLWGMIYKKKGIYLFWLLIGLFVGWGITSLPALSLGDGVWSLFIAGAIAIIAMILPGISGSYLLLILGKYTEVLGYVVDAVDAIVGFSFGEIPFFPLTIFVLGVVLGLGSFSRLLWWVKQHYHDQMVVVLIGFMLGALQTLRPRKETVSTYIDRYGVEQPLIQQNVLWPSSEALYIGIGFAVLGIFLVLGIHYGIEKLKKS